MLVAVVGRGGHALTDVPPASAVSKEQSTVIRYAGGEELARLGTNRAPCRCRRSEPAQRAVLAAENRGFYGEPGIGPKGIARAPLANVRGGGGVQQGGSTITQQYAKNAFLTSERTYTRKLKEIFIAVKMTRSGASSRSSRTTSTPSTSVAAPTASRRGAGLLRAVRQRGDADRRQGAVLASSIRSPAGYDRPGTPTGAKERWPYVLDGMVERTGSRREQRAAAIYPAVVPPGPARATPTCPARRARRDAVQASCASDGFDEDAVGGRAASRSRRPSTRRPRTPRWRPCEAVNKGDRGDGALQGALVAVVPGDGPSGVLRRRQRVGPGLRRRRPCAAARS